MLISTCQGDVSRWLARPAREVCCQQGSRCPGSKGMTEGICSMPAAGVIKFAFYGRTTSPDWRASRAWQYARGRSLIEPQAA